MESRLTRLVHWRIQSGKRRRGWPGLALLTGGLLLLIWLRFFPVPAVSDPIVAIDLEQLRANTPLPVPRGGLRIQQSFYPRWDGLQEIELIFARSTAAPAAGAGRLRLALFDDSDRLLAQEELATGQLQHNQTYLFRFPVQSRSAGRRYLLQVSGNAENEVSLWGYSLDVYRAGRLTLLSGPLEPKTPQTAAQELRFLTRYRLTWRDAAMALGTMLYREGPFLLLTLLLLPLPGALLLLCFSPARRWDPAAWWGTAYALGVTGWALIWFGLSLAGGRWRPWSLWMVCITGWLALIWLWRRPRRPQFYPWRRSHGWLCLLLLFALGVRLLAVRDVVFPPWVDSSRHGLITAVMAEQGRVPADYAPFLPVERFPYHFGFHTLSASLKLMTPWPLPRLLLFLGQLLNGLVPLTLYAAVWLLSRKKGAALLASFWVAVPSFFPAYYATWGRLTQLTAMLLMPMLLAFTWLVLRGGRRWRSAWWLVGMLAAGLFLVHFRVFLYYLPFVAVAWLISQGRHGRWLAAAAGLALLLTGPRIVQLFIVSEPAAALSATLPDYNLFPVSYVQVGWERHFIILALAIFFLLLPLGLWRRYWTALPLALAGWVALLFVLLAGQRLGLPETSLVNLNSMYIILFLPLAMFLGVTLDQFWRWLWRLPGLLTLPSALAAGAAIMLLLLYGARQQIHILNPQTILARSGDLAGLAWAAENLPEEAYLAVNSWLWLGNTWAGTDGGAWLVPLTGRRSTTPPIDHIYHRQLFQSVRAFNEAAAEVDDWSTPESAGWLRQQGVTHVFIGARGGTFDPAVLGSNPEMRLLYGQDGVFIFALNS